MPSALSMLLFFYLAYASANMILPNNQISNQSTSIELVEIHGAYGCIGQPHTCDYYDANEPYCILAGCTYLEGLCTGTPTECSSLSAEFCPLAGCEYSRGQSTWQNETIIRTSYSCNYCAYKDLNQMYFNMGMGILSLIIMIGLILIKKGADI
jgi:hypothetical protein